ncbi:MAG: WecB/TagA/CpsF family glycosyltransferase [Drouetiella hepatica Uher 2000/2452]|jgi:N-acetylglucosaminyldiphosphoundecaprenol N-acetyl-beta-D-mannosaminyltransferase|uniref:WecB/TagA/CpsF family glycosyltransferase n=1 Tax=Drouetiella hepatica Uher 2000/2452 TaxID=904376 RepID=A0A951QBP7_9CYAN|nr:WecB/TagA/CpsF family glycosyltransferase [Drouetiella hepatica Uher 2000/2452]
MLEAFPPIQNVIGFPVTALPFDAQISLVMKWASARLSKYVCVANVHMLMEAHTDPSFASVLEAADMVTPDGMPLVWLMKLMGVPHQDRVAGMDIFLALCKQASTEGISVFFLGSKPDILERMKKNLCEEFPELQVADMQPLPFRPLTLEEDEAMVQKINESGARLVLVSLGCPKQEIWMNQHQGKVEAVMLGLGGVFPVYAGIHKWAPNWVRRAGLEWLYRLLQEPRRLWRRYFATIPPFLYLASKQVLANWVRSLRKVRSDYSRYL